MARMKYKLLDLVPTNFRHQTNEFFNNSTLHGVRYIAEKGRSFGEKFMWFCCVAIGAVAAFVIIDSLWEKFQTNPTITGLDTDFHNQQLEFPTVTVCPVEPFDEEKVNETAFRTMADYDPDYYEYIPMLEILPNLTFDNFDIAYELNKALEQSDAKSEKFGKSTLRQLAFRIAMKCEDLLDMCSYRGEAIPCCEYFSPLFSERGYCYSFNSRYIGTADEEIRNEGINILYETDKRWAVSFVLNTPAKVYLHSVEEVSSYDTRPQFVYEMGHSVDLLITMKQTYTTDDAKQLNIGQRKCVFQGEVDLNYYQKDIYSISACMKQCRMQKANKLCKCIPPFYQPATGNYRQCMLSDFKCLKDNQLNITDIGGCKQCELSCLNTVYESDKYTKNQLSSSHKKEDFRVNIEFLTWPIIRYKREVLFGWVDLLVSFGGIAGLFLGFSLLSGVEIVYYFTMRAGCMFVKNRSKLYELQNEKETRPKPRYDLSITPKLEFVKQPMSSIQMVKPVEPDDDSLRPVNVKSFDGPMVALKNPNRGINRLDVLGRLRKDMSDKKFIPRRPNIFHSIHAAPYATRIKPLDKNFKMRSHAEGRDVMFHGYLP